MSFTPQQVEESAHQATPATEVTESMFESKGADGKTSQPRVSELYGDEKEQRLAEFVFALEKKRADANGGAARETKDTMLSELSDVMNQVSLHTLSPLSYLG
jgi:hypothetical protein